MLTKNKIGIVGTGKLGLCFALNLETVGYSIDAYDVNKDYINSLKNKTFKSYEKDVTELLQSSSQINFTTNINEVLNNDIIFIVVATPSLPNGKYDHSQIESFFDTFTYNSNNKDKEFIICCTVMPGYCEELKAKYGLKISYNPEFIAQGTIIHDQKNPDIVLIGEYNKQSGDIIQEIYLNLTNISKENIKRMSTTEAEITKIALNCFITTKIAFANMLGDLAIKSNSSPEKILNAIGSDKRVGNKYFNYGFGYGGPCFPRDNAALGIFCKESGISPLIQEATNRSNKLHLDYQVEDFKNKNNIDKPIMMDSITYKKGSILLDESQQLLFAEKLSDNGYDVTIKESEIVINELRKRYGNKFNYIINEKYDYSL